MIFILLITPLPGDSHPVPHFALPGVSLTPLGVAALAKLLVAKKVVGVGLLGAKKVAAAAIVGGKTYLKMKKMLSSLI